MLNFSQPPYLRFPFVFFPSVCLPDSRDPSPQVFPPQPICRTALLPSELSLPDRSFGWPSQLRFIIIEVQQAVSKVLVFSRPEPLSALALGKKLQVLHRSPSSRKFSC